MNLQEIKDECRHNLIKYLMKAFTIIPKIDNPIILDAGCGTGVPSLAIIKQCNGIIYGVDPDHSSIKWFNEKVSKLKLNDRIKPIHDSILNSKLFSFKFDIVIAEGLLNTIGFNKGLKALINNTKPHGYMIIHDELKNDAEKKKYFENNNLNLLDSYILNEDIWLSEYFSCLETKIKNVKNNSLFKTELQLIDKSKNNPNNLRSIYYVLQYGV